MIKKLLLTAIFTTLSYSAQISITSDSFEADENKKFTAFKSHVKIEKNGDIIKTDEAKVFFDKDNKPVRFESTKNVNFILNLKNSTIIGSCNKLIYVPKSKTYTLNGKVRIDEEPSKRKIEAQTVIIDMINNKINISGKKNKPVKFIFNVKEEK